MLKQSKQSNEKPNLDKNSWSRAQDREEEAIASEPEFRVRKFFFAALLSNSEDSSYFKISWFKNKGTLSDKVRDF